MVKPFVCVSVSILLVLLLALSHSSSTGPCCTDYYKDPIAVKYMRHFKFQNGTDYCNIKAIIFKLRKGKIVCANPDQPWVKKAIETVPYKP
ncbi:C-C motif chemokine 20 [Leuresthes tenuis]|uniref:C-C motif chemokine 20 n=1 Tax=Leuresthes tenuis TaxID=355514 RepID=UPI003B509AA7